MRVLIVDDDPAVRQIVATVLRRNGISSDVAEDGEVATALLSKRTYNAVVLDLLMPRLDGQGVIAFMKEHGITTPIIVVSAFAEEQGPELDPQLVRVVMPKPFDPRELRSVVEAVMTRV